MTDLPTEPTEYADAEGVLYRVCARAQVVIDCRRGTLVLGPNQARALGGALLRWSAATAGVDLRDPAELWAFATGAARAPAPPAPPEDLEQLYRELGETIGRILRTAIR